VTAGTLTSERAAALAAVRDAVRICRSVRADFGPDEEATKADHSPVTVADLASQAVISLALADVFPRDPVVGEEDSSVLRAAGSSRIAAGVLEHVSALLPDADMDRICWALDRCNNVGGPTGRHWTVDPVDGTKGFLRNDQYVVALALIEDGHVALGILGCPNLAVDPMDPAAGTGCVFVAERGAGAWQLPLDDAGEPSEGGQSAEVRLAVAAGADLSRARYVESVETGHSAQDVSREVATLLGITQPPRRLDSQAKYVLVARGEADLYLRFPRDGYVENAWDHAAGSIIVEEAGGRVSDAEGHPLDFRTGRTLTANRGLVVSSAQIHDQVLAAVERTLQS